MSCDHELANEWVRCSGRNASYITIQFDVRTTHGIFHWRLLRDNRWVTKSNVTTFLTKRSSFCCQCAFWAQSAVFSLHFGPRPHFVLDMQPAFCTTSAVLYLVCSLLFVLTVWPVFILRLPVNLAWKWNQTPLLNTWKGKDMFCVPKGMFRIPQQLKQPWKHVLYCFSMKSTPYYLYMGYQYRLSINFRIAFTTDKTIID